MCGTCKIYSIRNMSCMSFPVLKIIKSECVRSLRKQLLQKETKRGGDARILKQFCFPPLLSPRRARQRHTTTQQRKKTIAAAAAAKEGRRKTIF